MKIIAHFVCCAVMALTSTAYAQNRTVATVNGEAVLESRVTEQYDQIPADLAKGKEAEIKRQLLDRVIDQVLVEQEAQRLRIEDTEEYQKTLAQVKLQLKANAVVERYVKDSTTDFALRQRYAANKNGYAFSAIKAKHILVPTEQEARDIMKIVNPRNFAEVAKKRSKGPSAEHGGDLGWFRKEAMIEAFSNEAFRTPVGTISLNPIKTDFGWHVVLVEERNDKFIPPFEQMEAQLRQELASEITASYLGTLREKANVVYRDK